MDRWRRRYNPTAPSAWDVCEEGIRPQFDHRICHSHNRARKLYSMPRAHPVIYTPGWVESTRDHASNTPDSMISWQHPAICIPTSLIYMYTLFSHLHTRPRGIYVHVRRLVPTRHPVICTHDRVISARHPTIYTSDCMISSRLPCHLHVRLLVSTCHPAIYTPNRGIPTHRPRDIYTSSRHLSIRPRHFYSHEYPAINTPPPASTSFPVQPSSLEWVGFFYSSLMLCTRFKDDGAARAVPLPICVTMNKSQ